MLYLRPRSRETESGRHSWLNQLRLLSFQTLGKHNLERAQNPQFTNAQERAKDKDVSQQPAPPWPQAHQIKKKRPARWKIPASPDLRALYFPGRCWGVGGRRVWVMSEGCLGPFPQMEEAMAMWFDGSHSWQRVSVPLSSYQAHRHAGPNCLFITQGVQRQLNGQKIILIIPLALPHTFWHIVLSLFFSSRHFHIPGWSSWRLKFLNICMIDRELNRLLLIKPGLFVIGSLQLPENSIFVT